MAGAGVGILSVEAAYWLYPVITKTFFKKRYDGNVFLSPYAGRNELGLAFSMSF